MESVQRNRMLIAATLCALMLIAVLWQPVSASLFSSALPSTIKFSIGLSILLSTVLICAAMFHYLHVIAMDTLMAIKPDAL